VAKLRADLRQYRCKRILTNIGTLKLEESEQEIKRLSRVEDYEKSNNPELEMIQRSVDIDACKLREIDRLCTVKCLIQEGPTASIREGKEKCEGRQADKEHYSA
jgi:hypothetical protein